MTDHLPECDVQIGPLDACRICTLLRACEQRAYALGIEVGKHDGWIDGHAAGVAGVQAAQEVVQQYRVTIQRSGDLRPWRYWWSTSNGPWCHTGMTFTLGGAKRASRRAVIRFEREAERFEQRLTWTEPA